MRRTREQLAGDARGQARRGRAAPRAPSPTSIADVLFSLADGIALRMVAEPERDWAPVIAAGMRAIRPLLDAP